MVNSDHRREMTVPDLVPISEACGLSPHEWLDIVSDDGGAGGKASAAVDEYTWPAESRTAMLNALDTGF